MADKDASMNYQFTKAGHDLAIQALAGDTQLDFTKAVTSTDNHFADTEADTSGLTELANIQQTIELTEVDAVDDDPSFVKVPVMIDKSTITADYAMLTIGLYCKPKDGDEVLYGVCALQDPIYMHKSSNKSTYTIDLNTLVGSASSVTIKVDPAGMVSNSSLVVALKPYALNTDLDDYQPKGDYATHDDIKNVAYTDKPNVFTPQQTFNGGAVNAKGDAYITKADVPNPDLSSYLETADADKKYETLTDAANKVDKVKDSIGTRNYVLNTSDSTTVTANGKVGFNVGVWNLSKAVSDIAVGTPLIVSFDITVANSDEALTYVGLNPGWSPFICGRKYEDGKTHVDFQFAAPSDITTQTSIKMTADNSTATYTVSNLSLRVATVNTDWLPAPEDLKNNQNSVDLDPNTSQIINQTVKANVGQLLVGGQNAVGVMSDADPDEATAKSKSTDGLFHYTIES